MQIPMNVKMGVMGATTNVTTHWEASTVRATPALIWILMEGPASLVCSVLSSPYTSQLTFIELNLLHLSTFRFTDDNIRDQSHGQHDWNGNWT